MNRNFNAFIFGDFFFIHQEKTIPVSVHQNYLILSISVQLSTFQWTLEYVYVQSSGSCIDKIDFVLYEYICLSYVV